VQRGVKPRCEMAIIKLLGDGPLSVADMSKLANCVKRTAYVIVEKLHELRQIHIHAYESNKLGKFKCIWAIGDMADARKPAARVNAASQRAYRKRMSADDKDFLKARRRQKSRPIKLDPLTAAFFGGMK
jgi:hypothetical protein